MTTLTVRSALAKARAIQASTHAFSYIAPSALGDASCAEAGAANAARALAAWPLAVKENIAQTGLPCTAASRMLDGFRAEYTATAVQRLVDAGAVVVARTQMDEFGMGSASRFAPQPVLRTDGSSPGGSSGGSAVAVEEGAARVALGSDTGGSVRQPAARTRLVGVRPTYGAVSRHGLVEFVSSMDTIGVFARTADDAAAVLDVMSGPDEMDATTVDGDVARRAIYGSDAPLVANDHVTTVGVPLEYLVAELGDETLSAYDASVAELRARGIRVVPVSLPHTRYALPCYYTICPAEAASNLSRYDGVRYGHRAPMDDAASWETWYAASRSAGFGAEVKRRILVGTYVLSGEGDRYLDKAKRVRRLIRDEMLDVLRPGDGGVDALLTPAVPDAVALDGDESDFVQDVFLVAASLAGLPAVTWPASPSASLQLVGRPFMDQALLRCIASLHS